MPSVVQASKGDAENSDLPIRTLKPADENVDGIIIDADREVQFKLLIGKTGTKHSLLPDVASLGYMWFIPSFGKCKVYDADDGVPLILFCTTQRAVIKEIVYGR